jgi:hypothetical protein
MLEALASAFLLGGINTLADFILSELKLQARPIYVFARIVLICYCVGGIVGMRARQLMIGAVGGLMIGALVATVHYLLAPALGLGALALAWALFWIGFSLLDAVFRGGSGMGGALLQGTFAAVLSGVLFYALTSMWVEPASRDPNLFRVLALWTGAFFPGFIVLFWHRL